MSKKNAAEIPSGGPQGGSQGTGTDTLDVKGEYDPNASRKAIFARAGDMQTADRQIDTEQTPGAQELQQRYVQPDEGAEGVTHEGSAATADGDTPGESAIQPARAAEPSQPETAVVESAAPAAVETLPTGDPNEMVALKVLGKDVFRPRAEVDQKGGKEVYQILLAAEQKTAQADALRRRAEQKLAEATNQQRRFESNATTGTPPPNTGANAQPNQAPAAQLDPAVIDRMIEGLWSGEPEKAREAITEVLARTPRGQSIDMESLQNLVTARVDATIAGRDAQVAQESQAEAVNELMRQPRYAAIMADPVRKAMAVREFFAAEGDPRNKGRSRVDIAFENAERLLGVFGVTPDPSEPAVQPGAEVRGEISTRTNFKRRIPAPSNAHDRANSAQPEPRFPTKASDVINLMRQARGQPLLQ